MLAPPKRIFSGHLQVMMTDFAIFGSSEAFQIGVRWSADEESRISRPRHYGWSIGDLKIIVAGQELTSVRMHGRRQSFVGWYLYPFFSWLASNWAPLFHEECFAWTEKSSAPAAVACDRALRRLIAETDEESRSAYRDVRAWWQRHAIAASSHGGLFPEIYFRRFHDRIEVSWGVGAPLFAPEGFAFHATAGCARLAVRDVAGPLWEALAWCVSTPPAGLDAEDRSSLAALEARISAIEHLTPLDLASAYAPRRVLDLAFASAAASGARRLRMPKRDPDVPVLAELSDAVAMFGGITPNLAPADIEHLVELLVEARTPDDPPPRAIVERIAEDRPLDPLVTPHEDGYAFALETLATLEDLEVIGKGEVPLDIEGLLARLGVALAGVSLQTRDIRGVAFAGSDTTPTIVVNLRSSYNANPEGRRFSIVHELCHLLADRSRGRRIAHISGPWTNRGVERRANAFAAMFLMPRSALRAALRSANVLSVDMMRSLAQQLKVSPSALIEHLANIDLIDDAHREDLRHSIVR